MLCGTLFLHLMVETTECACSVTPLAACVGRGLPATDQIPAQANKKAAVGYHCRSKMISALPLCLLFLTRDPDEVDQHRANTRN